jgi:hypothetical protein
MTCAMGVPEHRRSSLGQHNINVETNFDCNRRLGLMQTTQPIQPSVAVHTGGSRTVSDSFGSISLPAGVLWGAQTARSLQFFAIGE